MSTIATEPKHAVGRLASAAVAVLLAASLVMPARAQGRGPRPADRAANVVYVESNIGTPGGNSIFAFRRDAAGNLTPLSGSPFPTGGTGVFDPSLNLGPFDSDQNIILNADRTRLFAVNSGSNSVAVFDVLPDGSLAAVKGSPFPSGGQNPVSVGLSGDILTVVNKDEDPNQNIGASLPNYTTFRVDPNGKLIPVPHSTVSVPQGSSPSQALVSPTGQFFFGADFMAGVLQSFVLLPNGRLFQNPPTPVPAAEFAAAPHLALGLHAHPTQPVLYAGFVPIGRLGVYTYAPDGVLSFVRSVPNSGAAICWVTGNRAGTRLYTSNTGDNSVSVYDTTDPLNPVEIQHVVLAGEGSVFQPALDSAEQFLYVVSQRSGAATPLGQGNSLHVLSVDPATGMVAEVASSPTALPVPPGTRPQGVAAL